MTGSDGNHPTSCRSPESCDLSYADHLRSIAISAAATPTRRPDTASTIVKDRVLDRDLDAYKRLRRDGVQPPRNQGSAALEQTATHRWDIETKPRQECET